MTHVGAASIAAALLALAPGQAVRAATNETPDFKEVYQLIQTNLAGVSGPELNRAAVQGLLKALGPRAALVRDAAPGTPSSETGPVTKTNLFDGRIAYIRVGAVSARLAGEVENAYRSLASTNTLDGVVLDLRYADGSDYAAAAAAADLFAHKAKPLLNWGAGTVAPPKSSSPIQAPVAVLVNHDTAEAAEALAVLSREGGSGLILGARTAGCAMIMKEFPLAEGGRLRIAVAPVTLGDGVPLGAGGVQPDISVVVSPEDERAYYGDAYLALSAAGSRAGTPGSTNAAARRPRLNEAELVREHQEGADHDEDGEASPSRPAEPTKPVVTDPVLARALDLLKGLAVVRQTRS